MFHGRVSMLRLIVLPAVLAGLVVAGGCAGGPTVIPPDQRTMIDRQLVEYPAGVDLQVVAEDLTGPVDCAVDKDGTLIVAESGRGKYEPRIYAIRKDGTMFNIYPTGRRFPQPLRWLQGGFRLYGPIGGIAVDDGKVYVSHRDKDDFGVITAFTYDGKHTTIVGKLPAQGDYGMGDIAIHPPTGRLWFGVGAATNSGVVGLDNWAAGWVKNHPNFSDRPWLPPGQSLLKLLGYRFDTPNPLAGLFGGKDVAGTAPFQPFNSRYRGRIPRAENNRPTAAVFSCDPAGGGLMVEAYGVRYARGIAFDEYGSAFMTNNGMELRGTRPVKDDPDAVLSIVRGTWYGWPDYSADLRPISSEQFQPSEEMLVTYQEVNEVIDHRGSGLDEPSRYRESLVQAVLPPLSGAAGIAFVPNVGPLSVFSGHAIVALSGDRAPFATSGRKLRGPTGYRIVRVNSIDKEVSDFVRNTAGVPRSRQKLTYHHVSLERPMSVKFDLADGSMYIVDFGVLEMRKGKEFVKARTGRIFKLVPQAPPTTQPTTTAITGSKSLTYQQSSSLEAE
jgi:glucose/arabinose dehydrogenase